MSRMFHIVLLLGLCATASAAGLPDETSGGVADETLRSVLDQEEISLTDLFRLAELASPTLAAAENRAQAGIGRTRQAGLYANPVIEFEVGEMSTSDSDDRKDKVSLVQSLILGRRRRAAVDAVSAEQGAAALRFHHARRTVFEQIQRLYAEQLYFREADVVLEELLRVANETLEIASLRFDARAAPESQVTKALLEVYELESTRQQLAQEQAKGSATLSSLLGGAPLPVDRLAGALDPDSGSIDLDALSADDSQLATFLDDHPAVRAAGRDIDAADSQLREARAARIPDLGLFVAYGTHRATDQEFMEVGLSVPLPVFDRNQGRVIETRALVAQTQNTADRIRIELIAAFKAARQRYLTTRTRLDATVSRIVPAAERGLSQTQEGYQVGRLPFLELIDAQRTLADVRLRILELRKDLSVAEAELMSIIGAGPYGTQGEAQS